MVLTILLHLRHDVFYYSQVGPIRFYPLFLGVGRRSKGRMAAHLFVAHELAEGQRRGRVCLFSGLGAQKATRPNKRTKQIGEIRGRNINIKN